MAKRKIFYSFHFDNDVFRVQQVRQMGVIEGNEPVAANTWEQLKKNDSSVEKWIDENMSGKSCVIVLIGTDTHKRPWVKYEIKKAWKDGKGLLGIHIHTSRALTPASARKAPTPSTRSRSSAANRCSFQRSTTRRRTTHTATSRTTYLLGLKQQLRSRATEGKVERTENARPKAELGGQAARPGGPPR